MIDQTNDGITLLVNGQKYDFWESVTITRSLKEAASAFEVTVTERWAGVGNVPTPWQIARFDNVQIQIGTDTVLTGYVEKYDPEYDAKDHKVKISGRSKTCDIVDCMPEVGSGQFNGYDIDAVAKALCAKFGIKAVIECDTGDTFPNVTFEKTETAFKCLEKLARLREVLITDNETGDLVITQAGKKGNASGSLVEGDNIYSASAKLDCHERFQQYAVYSQAPLAFDGQDSHNDIIGTATDPACPRYRRFAEHAEDPADTGLAKKRAVWRAKHNAAIGNEATIVVRGFRQDDGKLWDTNYLVPVTSPRLALDRTMLISKVAWTISEHGRFTHITVAPQEAFTPEPDAPKSKGKTAGQWNDVIPIK